LVKVLVFDCIFWEVDFDKNVVTGPVAGTVDASTPVPSAGTSVLIGSGSGQVSPKSSVEI